MLWFFFFLSQEVGGTWFMLPSIAGMFVDGEAFGPYWGLISIRPSCAWGPSRCFHGTLWVGFPSSSAPGWTLFVRSGVGRAGRFASSRRLTTKRSPLCHFLYYRAYIAGIFGSVFRAEGTWRGVKYMSLRDLVRLSYGWIASWFWLQVFVYLDPLFCEVPLDLMYCSLGSPSESLYDILDIYSIPPFSRRTLFGYVLNWSFGPADHNRLVSWVHCLSPHHLRSVLWVVRRNQGLPALCLLGAIIQVFWVVLTDVY